MYMWESGIIQDNEGLFTTIYIMVIHTVIDLACGKSVIISSAEILCEALWLSVDPYMR